MAWSTSAFASGTSASFHVHQQSVQPRIQPINVAQAWQVSLRLDQGLLHRILREVNFAKDQAGDGVQPIHASGDQCHKRAVIAKLGRLDQGSRHPSTPLRADRPGLVWHR